jgi:phosphomannomutase
MSTKTFTRKPEQVGVVVMSQPLSCFKAYDVRGRVPDQLNEDIAYRIGRAYADVIKASSIVVGYDIRLSSRDLCEALSRGLRDSGVDVLSIGQCGTEEIYFAAFNEAVDGGIVVTASHNPADYNGMKFVRKGARPISGDTGLFDIRDIAQSGRFKRSGQGSFQEISTQAAYIEHLLTYLDVARQRPLKIVVNAGNGGAGVVIDALEPHLPFEFIKVYHEPDGSFPHGVPNPLLPENRDQTIDVVRQHGADLGIAWDGDFDRCFFFDEEGRFIEGYYLVGLLADALLRRHPGEKVVHDPRLTWNTIDIVESLGGMPVQSKTGHAFIKERMRSEDAIYGGEMSAHHYFRDFAYCDSGMIPWLMVCQLMLETGKPLSELIAERVRAFPVSGEINSEVADPAGLLLQIEQRYIADALKIEQLDGLSMEFESWRFNVRMSNTEPVLRLNVESRADTALMEAKTAELLAMIRAR